MAATVLAATALAGLGAAVVCLIQLHRLEPDVAPVHDPVSDYGAGPHANWYRAQVILVGLATAALWFGLRSADLDGDGSAWLVVLGHIHRLRILQPHHLRATLVRRARVQRIDDLGNEHDVMFGATDEQAVRARINRDGQRVLLRRTNRRTGRILLAVAAFGSVAVAASTLGGWLADTPEWSFDGAGWSIFLL